MTGMIVSVIILCIGNWILFGFSFATVLATVATLLFCGRRFGYLCTLPTLLKCDCIGLMLTTVLSLLFHKFILWKFVTYIIVRVVFYAIVGYDIKEYVYKEEEVLRKED